MSRFTHRTAGKHVLRPSLMLALVLLSLSSLPFAAPATRAAVPESHGRLGELTWRMAATNTAAFHSVVGFRRSYYSPPPNVGDTYDVGSEGAINYGDSGASDGMYHVVAVDLANDWFLASKDVTYAYASAGPWTAFITGCCRLSTPQHINNPDESFRYEAIVDFTATTANPETSLPPVVDCPLNAVCSFRIVAVDPAQQTMRFRFATATEAGDATFVQPGPPSAPNAATISPAGQYTWNTTGATLNTTGNGDTYYSTQVMIEALDASSTVVTKSPVDFFIRLSTSANHPPVFVSPPTPPDGTHFQIGVGNYLAMRIQARDPDAGDNVTLAILNEPHGASFPIPAPANQVASTFIWTPTAADVGQYVLNFTAADPSGAQALVSISIDVVAMCSPYFTDVHSGPNPPQDYFYVPVQYLFCHNVVSGYTETDGTFTYRPSAPATRGQFSKMIVLSKGWAIDTGGGPHFSDVPASSPFYSYVETAFHHGVISGYGDGTFHPNTPVTRGQLCKLIVVAQAWTIDTSGGPHFSDVPASNPFYGFVETAYHHTIVSGYGDGTFRWGNNATRGQISKILWNALGSPGPAGLRP